MFLESSPARISRYPNLLATKRTTVSAMLQQDESVCSLSVEERDNLVKDSVDVAINKCTELEIPVEDRKVRRKKNARPTRRRCWP